MYTDPRLEACLFKQGVKYHATYRSIGYSAPLQQLQVHRTPIILGLQMTIIVNEDKFLELPNGRTLAYQDIGDASGSIVVLFFHGNIGVGNASIVHPVFQEKCVHFIAPTLPGWGRSTPRDSKEPYDVCIATSISTLLDTLHPNDPNLKIYVSGGSFGTVPAQILYGASFDLFPYGRQIAGCLIYAPFSPPKYHLEQSKLMTFPNWVSVGSPSQMVPYRLVQRLILSCIIRGKVRTADKAEALVRELFFDSMNEGERAVYEQWKEKHILQEGELERSVAQDMVKSISYSGEGFLEMADAIHSDWGFNPDALDEDHNQRPILIVTSSGDTMAPEGMAIWLNRHYKNSHLERVEGSHIAAYFHLDELWRKMFEMTL